jgi:putative transposase
MNMNYERRFVRSGGVVGGAIRVIELDHRRRFLARCRFCSGSARALARLSSAPRPKWSCTWHFLPLVPKVSEALWERQACLETPFPSHHSRFMRSRYSVREPEQAHFVTSTIVNWLPVFQTTACCDILVSSLDFCRREKGLRLYAWVILENQFHAVVRSDNFPRVMADLKKFTAGKLLAQLEVERRTWLLDLLASGKADHKTRSTWQIWQEGYHPQAIYSNQTMQQSRAERDRLRAEPQPRGCRRRAASTSTTFTPTPSAAVGWIHRSIGATVPRMYGCLAAIRYFNVMTGGEMKRGSAYPTSFEIDNR